MPRCASLPLVAVVLLAAASCDEQRPQAKLVGTWRLVRSEVLPLGAVTTHVFNDNGTASTTLVSPTGKESQFTNTWKVSGTSLMMTTRSGAAEKTDEVTIMKLTDQSLVTRDRGGREEEFVRMR